VNYVCDREKNQPPVNARRDVVDYDAESSGEPLRAPRGERLQYIEYPEENESDAPHEGRRRHSEKRHLHPDELVDDDARGVPAPVFLGLMREIDRDGNRAENDDRIREPPAPRHEEIDREPREARERRRREREIPRVEERGERRDDESLHAAEDTPLGLTAAREMAAPRLMGGDDGARHRKTKDRPSPR
jgi:hypothetical protein